MFAGGRTVVLDLTTKAHPGDTVAVTVEPAGGSHQPTTQPIAAASRLSLSAARKKRVPTITATATGMRVVRAGIGQVEVEPGERVWLATCGARKPSAD